MQAAFRKDIEGLRALAVLAVIAFHLGYLPNGYLGVDVFFVISGYLITGIIARSFDDDQFSISTFYLRRIRRIIPLTLFIGCCALIVGFLVMLPGDLKNLSQSIIATNAFANNIQLYYSTRDYWDVANHFKPLMHTWSLGIEEQFYLLYPLIFILLRKASRRWIIAMLVAITAISFWLFYQTPNPAFRFYLLPYRFFELSIGGIAALSFSGKYSFVSKLWPLWLAGLILLLCWNAAQIPDQQRLVGVVLCSVMMVGTAACNRPGAMMLTNPLIAGIGRISFSLYMWHQLVFAFYRYCINVEISGIGLIVVCCMVLGLSLLSYYLIEQPFRDSNQWRTRPLLMVLGLSWIMFTGCASFIYLKKGIVRDVPELNVFLDMPESMEDDNEFNNSVRLLDKDFPGVHQQINILVVGNSFARDWANILKSASLGEKTVISYTEDISACPTRAERLQKADYIFFTEIRRSILDYYAAESPIDTNKVWIIGAKNFGMSNGVFYRNRGSAHYCQQRTKMQKGYQEHNDFLKREWNSRCIDLIGLVQARDGTMPVFTPQCTFISHDCRHLTRDGARYYAQLLAGHHVIKSIKQASTQQP